VNGAVGAAGTSLRRSPILTLGFFIFVIFAAYQTSQYIIKDDVPGLAYVAMAFVGGAVAVAILNNWRNGVYFFLIWLFFEDFARKFLGNNMAIFFAKDALVLIVYLSFFIAYRRRTVETFKVPFRLPLLLLLWFGLIQVFNPASTSIFFGLLGLKLYFYYVPLLFIGFALFRSERDLRRFFFLNLTVALVILSLGIAQSILGHTFLNPQVINEDIKELSSNYRVAPISGTIVYRPNSVFVSTGRYSNFILLMWILSLGFSGYLLLRHKRGRALAFLALAFTAAGGALTASRSSFMLLPINGIVTSVAFLWGAPWRRGEVIRVLRGIQRVILGMIVAAVALLALFPDAILGRIAIYSETLLPGSSATQLTDRTWNYPFGNFIGAFSYERWPYGYGIGTASLGVQYVTRFFHAKAPTAGTESGFGTLVVEMGIVGLLLWIILATSICVSAWKITRKLKGTPWFPLAFVITWYAFLLLFAETYLGIQPYQDFVLNAYLWLSLGILFRLPGLALSSQFAIDATPAQISRPGIR